MNKTQAAKKKADWLAYCLSIGWEKKELDDLSKVWDDYYDEEGNRRSRLQSPSTPILGAEETDLDLIREFVDFVSDSNAAFIKSTIAEFWYISGRKDPPKKDEFILEFLKNRVK